jgi:hypothetical protein
MSYPGEPRKITEFFRPLDKEVKPLVLVAFHFRVFKGKIVFVPKVVVEILAVGMGLFEFRPDLGGDPVVVLNVSAREHDLQDILFTKIF